MASSGAGKYRHRVAIKEPMSVQSSSGEVVTAYRIIGHDYAAFAPVSGREFVASVGAQAELTARFTLRFRDDVTPTWRVRYDGHDYEIVHVEDVNGRQRETMLHVRRLYET